MKKSFLLQPADRFSNLIRPHVRSLYESAFKLTGSRDDAEDIVQEMLVKLYPKIKELEELRDPKPWLQKVLYRQFIDFRRKKLRNPATPNQTVDDAGNTDAIDAMDNLEAKNKSPEAELIENRESARVLRALASLDDDVRALLVFNIMDGYTLEQLTTVFDVPIGTLKSRMHRAKALLKKRLSVEPFSLVHRDETGENEI